MSKRFTIRNGLLLAMVLVLMTVLLFPQLDAEAAGKRHIQDVDGVSYVYDAGDQPVKNSWSQIDGKWYLTDASGAVLKDSIVTKKGQKYYLGKDGAMATGIFEYKSVTYICDPETGVLYTKQQWVTVDGKKYLVDAGSKMVKDQVVTVSGNKYYLDANGRIKTGLVKAGKDYYVAKKTGVIRVTAGWVSLNGKWYYVTKGGKLMQNEVLKSKGKVYFLGADCSLGAGVAKVDGVVTYFDKSGSPGKKNGWVEYNGEWYYLKAGVALTNSVVGSGAKMYYVGKDGTLTQGVYKSGDKYYYFNKNGKVQTKAGWVKYNKNWYYADKGGVLRTNSLLHLGGKTYYLKANGVMATGITKIDDSLRFIKEDGSIKTTSGWVQYKKKWYFVKKNGILCANSKSKISGKFYYFNAKAEMQVGFIKVDKDTAYYAKKSGVLVTDKTFTYNGKTYYAGVGGVILLNGVVTKAQGYSSSSGYLIMVDLTGQRTYVFKGKKGEWKITESFTCSTGTRDHPTPEGEYNTTMRTRFFNSFGYRCWWATGFIGGEYLFHSSPYTMTDEPKVCADRTMGVPSSHGCIRMNIDDAKWIYDNIPIGTHLVIFK